MKKLLILLFSLIFAISMLSGCGSGAKTGKDPDKEVTSKEDTSKGDEKIGDKETEKAMDDLAKAMEVLAVKGWPKDKVPKDLPEYKGGEIVNSGGSEKEFYIKIENSTEEELGKYLEELKNAGWNVSDDPEPEIRKGIYDVDFNWQGKNMLQMTIYTSEVASWPKEVPSDIFPPDNCTLIGEISIQEVSDNAWYFNYQCDGVNEEGTNKYIEKLRKEGWEGDASQLSKTFQWKSKSYIATIELYEQVGSSATFTCNYAINTD